MRIINDIYKATCRFCLFVFFVLASCAIENDIPYPIVTAGITDIRVEGQRRTSSGNFKINLFSINIGMTFYL